MTPFVPREKMSKKARRELDSKKRAAWSISPVTRRAESKKAYSRKRKPRIRWDEPLPFLMSAAFRQPVFNYRFNASPRQMCYDHISDEPNPETGRKTATEDPDEWGR